MPSRLFAACLGAIVLIGPMAIHLFLPCIPAVKAEFGLSEAAAQLTFSVGIFALAFSTLVYGNLSDLYGRRPVLLGGLALFLVGSALNALAVNLSMLIVGRVLQAAGAGCATTLVRTIARDAYGQEQLVKAIAYLTMFYTLGPMIAPLVGGVLIDAYGWRAAFWFALVFGAAITAGAYLVLGETHHPKPGRFDAVAMLRGTIQPFSNPRFAAFLLQTGFSTGIFFTLTAASSVIMKEQLGRSSTEYGMFFLTFPIGYLAGNIISSRLAGRVSIERMVLAGSLVMVTGVVLQSALLGAGWITPLVLFGPGFLVTFAQGIALPSAQSGAMAMLPSAAGTAAALGVFTQMLIGAAMAQVYGFVAGPGAGALVVVNLVGAALVLACGLLPWRTAGRAAR